MCMDVIDTRVGTTWKRDELSLLIFPLVEAIGVFWALQVCNMVWTYGEYSGYARWTRHIALTE